MVIGRPRRYARVLGEAPAARLPPFLDQSRVGPEKVLVGIDGDVFVLGVFGRADFQALGLLASELVVVDSGAGDQADELPATRASLGFFIWSSRNGITSGSPRAPAATIAVASGVLFHEPDQPQLGIGKLSLRMAIAAARSAKVPPASAMSWRLATAFLCTLRRALAHVWGPST